MSDYIRKARYQDERPDHAISAFAPEKKPGTNPYSGKPLPVSGKLAGKIRDSFGIDAGQLSLREAPELDGIGARATAQGNVIRFAPGEFRPDTGEGMSVLGHELNHVREQAMGAVRAPVGELFEHPAHEAASDKAGAAFAGGGLSAATAVSPMSAGSAPVQGSFRKGLRNMFYNAMGKTEWGRNKLEDSATTSVERQKREKSREIQSGTIAPEYSPSEEDMNFVNQIAAFGKHVKPYGARMDSYKLNRDEYSSAQRKTGEKAVLQGKQWSVLDQTLPAMYGSASAYHAIGRKNGNNAYRRIKNRIMDEHEQKDLTDAQAALDMNRETLQGELRSGEVTEERKYFAQSLRNLLAYRKSMEAGENPGLEMLYRAADNDVVPALPEDPEFFFGANDPVMSPEEKEGLQRRRRQERYGDDYEAWMAQDGGGPGNVRESTPVPILGNETDAPPAPNPFYESDPRIRDIPEAGSENFAQRFQDRLDYIDGHVNGRGRGRESFFTRLKKKFGSR